jgi:fluoroquinolone transport system permease protein
MRLLHLIIQNIQFQFRHGFYLVYLVISMSYVAILRIMPDQIAQKAFILLIFSDVSILGLFFIGAIVFLERDQGIMQTLFVTPLSISEYIFGQALSLTILSLLMGFLIAFLRFGHSFNLIPVIAAIISASILSTLTGIAIAVKQRRVTSYFVIATVITLPFFLPVFNYLQITTMPLLQCMPTTSILNLLESAFTTFSTTTYITAGSVLVAWGIFIAFWTMQRFDRYIIRKVGEIE